MGEAGLSPAEVGKEIAEHRRHHGAEATGHDRIIGIAEATLLAVVAVLAAWSGYASAKWSTESRLLLAQGATARTEASEAEFEALEARNLDSSSFEAWFAAFTVGNEEAMAIAERRFRPEFEVAFEAWMATDPVHNPDAPKGPMYMEEYETPKLDEADALHDEADDRYAEGAEAGITADDYVKITVFLASVLFLVGISGQFRVKAARVGLVVVGGGILTWSIVLLLLAPRPPA